MDKIRPPRTGQNSPLPGHPPKHPLFVSFCSSRAPETPLFGPLPGGLPEPPKSASRRGAPAGGNFADFRGGGKIPDFGHFRAPPGNPHFWPFLGGPGRGSWEGVWEASRRGVQKGVQEGGIQGVSREVTGVGQDMGVVTHTITTACRQRNARSASSRHDGHDIITTATTSSRQVTPWGVFIRYA